MSLLKLYEFTDEPVICRQETVRMAALPKVTRRLPVVAQEPRQEAAVTQRRLHVTAVRNTPLPDVLELHRAPVYRVWIDGALQPALCDLNGVDLLVGCALRKGARYIEVFEDEARLYEVKND